jgi:competence protein ComEA
MLDLTRREQIVLVVIMIAMAIGGGALLIKDRMERRTGPRLTTETLYNPSDSIPILVHVTGAVRKKGVIELKAGSRTIDAVKRAQPLPEADIDRLNLAKILEDGEKIIVPYKEEIGTSSSPSSSLSPSMKIDVNMATEEELRRYLRIPERTAKAIVDYREKTGGFKSKEELMNVPGIGQKTFDRIKDVVTVQ